MFRQPLKAVDAPDAFRYSVPRPEGKTGWVRHGTPPRSESNVMDNFWTSIRHIVDTLSAGAIIGALIGVLPAIAAAGAFVWYLIQIYESRTVQHWLANRKMVQRARKLAKLRAQEKMVLAQIEALATVKTAERAARAKVADAATEAAKEVIQAETQIKEDTANSNS